MTDQYQNIILHLKGGQRIIASIPASLKGGEIVERVEITPPIPMPDGVSWEKIYQVADGEVERLTLFSIYG